MLLCPWADARNWNLIFYSSAYNLTTALETQKANYPLFTLTYSSVCIHTTFFPACHFKWLCHASVFFPHCLRGRPVIRQSSRVTWWLYTFLNRLFRLHQRFSSLGRPGCDERLGSAPAATSGNISHRVHEECVPKHMDGLIIWKQSQIRKKITFNSLIYSLHILLQKQFITVINLELTEPLRLKSDLMSQPESAIQLQFLL